MTNGLSPRRTYGYAALRAMGVETLASTALGASTWRDRCNAAEMLHARILERERTGEIWTPAESAALRRFVESVRERPGYLADIIT